jgi:NADP-dependent 3-hydroxy acid dehydrogenase YdfG
MAKVMVTGASSGLSIEVAPSLTTLIKKFKKVNQ